MLLRQQSGAGQHALAVYRAALALESSQMAQDGAAFYAVLRLKLLDRITGREELAYLDEAALGQAPLESGRRLGRLGPLRQAVGRAVLPQQARCV